MGPIRRAVIDVGTNSVKLLVADVAGREIEPLCEQSKQTRLGHGFYETRRLKPEAIAATAKAVADFAATARQAQAVSIRVIATSAAREALNREELTAAIEQASALKVEVISGEQEAEWGFLGVTTDPQLARAPLLLMDVGGGSTQFVFGADGQVLFRHSFPLGTVRLMETIPCSDPPKPAELTACRHWLKDFLQNEVRPKLVHEVGGRGGSSLNAFPFRHPAPGEDTFHRVPVSGHWEPAGTRPHHPGSEAHREDTGSDPTPPASAATGPRGSAQLVGVGGTATILGSMEAGLDTFDRARIEATRLSAARLSWHFERLWGLPLEQRKAILGLPKNRADVILMGVAVYYAVIEEFGFPELRLSTRGLRFAALMQPTPESPRRPSAQAP
jgi:exopolyphosphatase/guanosine-5'-triphosphate,3'-diphosphate pyrophosphatase